MHFRRKNCWIHPKTLKFPKPPKKIAGPIPLKAMEEEIEKLRENDKRLLVSKNYEVFWHKLVQFPIFSRKLVVYAKLHSAKWVKAPIIVLILINLTAIITYVPLGQ